MLTALGLYLLGSPWPIRVLPGSHQPISVFFGQRPEVDTDDVVEEADSVPILNNLRGSPCVLAEPREYPYGSRLEKCLSIINFWNSLPLHMLTACSLGVFRNQISQVHGIELHQ